LGGIRSFQKNAISTEEVKRSIREQLFWLLNEGVDGLLFETYYDFEELKTVLSLARKETSKPIITHVSLHDIGVLQNGTSLYDAFQELESLG
ncbi:homocysteine S-methyltransferase family protein, partial [Escherichia coli]|nr:homocysteine S-methyltransferase family protein [Escherichia coli]